MDTNIITSRYKSQSPSAVSLSSSKDYWETLPVDTHVNTVSKMDNLCSKSIRHSQLFLGLFEKFFAILIYTKFSF